MVFTRSPVRTKSHSSRTSAAAVDFKKELITNAKPTADTDLRSLLSTLWLVALLNIIVRDIHDLFRPSLLAEMMSGIVNFVPVTDGVLLLGRIGMEIPIGMVLLSLVLPYCVNGWANMAAATLTLAFVLFTGPADLDDIFFAGLESAALIGIIWLAWRTPTHHTYKISGGSL